MKLFLMIVELIIGLALTGAIMLQPPKGEGMGAIGGQARMFHQVRGLNSGLDRLCIALAAAFMIIALILSFTS